MELINTGMMIPRDMRPFFSGEVEKSFEGKDELEQHYGETDKPEVHDHLYKRVVRHTRGV